MKSFPVKLLPAHVRASSESCTSEPVDNDSVSLTTPPLHMSQPSKKHGRYEFSTSDIRRFFRVEDSEKVFT